MESEQSVPRSDKHTRWEPLLAQRYALILAAFLAIVLWLMQANPYLNPADDSGRYMVLGESLARYGKLQLINDIRLPADTLYPHGFPLIIAFWLKVTGREPGGVVLLVKLTQLLLMLGTLPLMALLLSRLKVPSRLTSLCLLTYAVCPAMISYANEVMSEMPMLFLCLASVLCSEGSMGLSGSQGNNTKSEEENGTGDSESDSVSHVTPGVDEVPVWRRVLGLVLGAMAFMVRTSGIALLFAQVIWCWRRFGWRWGLVATLVMFGALGGWILRNRAITKAHPEIHYSSYIDQFKLRDPMKPNAGRIQMNARGIASRIKSGFPAYIGFLPRAVLHMMPRYQRWNLPYYTVAISLTGLMLVGWLVALRRGYWLTGGFAALFWFVVAMWPWLSARFLMPILPLLFAFSFVGADWLTQRLVKSGMNARAILGVQGALLLVMLGYFVDVHHRVIQQEHHPVVPGYTLGRSKAEAGFYAACEWLHLHADARDVVMGKPQYLVHLYSGNYTTQLEPTTNPKNLERGTMLPYHVRYVLQDVWPWGMLTSKKILDPYFEIYGSDWELVWSDPHGSGVRVWRRK